MRYYPVNLDIEDRNCLVVGGGSVGARKAQSLLNCGAYVIVVSPKIEEKLKELLGCSRLRWTQRNYRPSDLDGVFLVIGATDDDVLNRSIHKEAGQRNILCNIADRPEICDFTLPAVVGRGDLTIAISTSGKSPAFAKHLKEEIAGQYGEEYAEFLRLMGEIRRRLLKDAHAPEIHKPVFEQLISRGLLDLVRSGAIAGIDELLEEILGNSQYRYDQLMNNEWP